eukprot:Colp12_sorted_trinity150504_noHs@18029
MDNLAKHDEEHIELPVIKTDEDCLGMNINKMAKVAPVLVPDGGSEILSEEAMRTLPLKFDRNRMAAEGLSKSLLVKFLRSSVLPAEQSSGLYIVPDALKVDSKPSMSTYLENVPPFYRRLIRLYNLMYTNKMLMLLWTYGCLSAVVAIPTLYHMTPVWAHLVALPYTIACFLYVATYSRHVMKELLCEPQVLFLILQVVSLAVAWCILADREQIVPFFSMVIPTFLYFLFLDAAPGAPFFNEKVRIIQSTGCCGVFLAIMLLFLWKAPFSDKYWSLGPIQDASFFDFLINRQLTIILFTGRFAISVFFRPNAYAMLSLPRIRR